MNGDELAQLIQQRWTTLRQLLDLGNQQADAIHTGHMNELMAVLSQKQSPLNRLAEISTRIRAAAADDPESRSWSNPTARDQCRRQQDECEQMHMELLAIEAACESALQESRAVIGQQIEQLDASHRAARHYQSESPALSAGGRLDLSE